MKVPDATRVAVSVAAGKLRQRAATLRPDEELTESIARNAVVADEFARAYTALRAIGLEDKALERFGVENATGQEMRDAADLLEQLARAEDVPGPKVRGEVRMRRSHVRKHRWGVAALAVVIGLPVLYFGGVLFKFALDGLGEWRITRASAREPVVVASAVAPAKPAPPSPPLVPFAEGFERTAANEIVPPKPKDFVTDRARVLSEDAARALNGRLLQFESETSNQLLVFVDRSVPAETTMEEMTSASIRHWGVGQKGKDNGAIFFVFLDDRKMRIEVGYGLEGVLTDARSRRILDQVVRPLFREEKYAEGIAAGAQMIMDVTRNGDAALELASAVPAAQVHVSIVPVLLLFLIALACFAVVWFLVRSAVLFFQGRATGLFAGTGTSRGGGSSSGSSSSSSSSSGSSGSFSSGGGSGGGGGASSSW